LLAYAALVQSVLKQPVQGQAGNLKPWQPCRPSSSALTILCGESGVTEYSNNCEFSCVEVPRSTSQQDFYAQQLLRLCSIYCSSSCATNGTFALCIDRWQRLQLQDKAPKPAPKPGCQPNPVRCIGSSKPLRYGIVTPLPLRPQLASCKELTLTLRYATARLSCAVASVVPQRDDSSLCGTDNIELSVPGRCDLVSIVLPVRNSVYRNWASYIYRSAGVFVT